MEVYRFYLKGRVEKIVFDRKSYEKLIDSLDLYKEKDWFVEYEKLWD